MTDVDRMLRELGEQLPGDLELPPRCFTQMGGKIVSYEPNTSFVTEWPLETWYGNPAMVLQGGIAMAMIDNTFGPFSFLEAKGPTTSLDMQISYLRPVPIDSGNVTVRVNKQSQTKSYIHFNGELVRADGKVASIATTRMAILKAR